MAPPKSRPAEGDEKAPVEIVGAEPKSTDALGTLKAAMLSPVQSAVKLTGYLARKITGIGEMPTPSKAADAERLSVAQDSATRRLALAQEINNGQLA